MYFAFLFSIAIPFIFFRGEYGIQQYSEVKTVGDKQLKAVKNQPASYSRSWTGPGRNRTRRYWLKLFFSGFFRGSLETEFNFIFLFKVDYLPPPPPFPISFLVGAGLAQW